MKNIRKKKNAAEDTRIRVNAEQSPGYEESYAAQERERFSIGREKRNTILCGVVMLAVLLFSFLLVNILLDNNLSAAVVGHSAMRRVNDFFDLISGNHLQSHIDTFLCSFLCPLFCGIALASSGACFQAVFHNPMASPTMLGIETGGTLGTSIFILFFGTQTYAQFLNVDYEGYSVEFHAMTALQQYGQYFATFLGCLAVVAFILAVTKITGRNRVRTIPLLVGGSVFTTLVNSVLQAYEYFLVKSGSNVMVITQLQQVTSGKFQNILLPRMMVYMAVPVIISFIVLLFFTGRLNIIAFGDEEARLMGINVEKDRIIVLVLSTLLTAAIVAFCGTIGFVGLIIPHIARNIVGSDFRYLVPASGFIGAVFMILAYDFSYMTGGIIDTAVVINVVGGVIFLVIMVKYRRQGNADWA